MHILSIKVSINVVFLLGSLQIASAVWFLCVRFYLMNHSIQFNSFGRARQLVVFLVVIMQITSLVQHSICNIQHTKCRFRWKYSIYIYNTLTFNTTASNKKITEKNEINVVHKTPICHKIHWLFVVLYYDLGFRFL